MNLLQFTLPPLPHYIVSGYTTNRPGDRHVSRRNIEVFDLLFVKEGCLYIGEEDRKYDVAEGCAVILRPDCYHYGAEACRERTSYFWLHFQTTGNWTATDVIPQAGHPEPHDEATLSRVFAARSFPLLLPQFAKVKHPGKMEETLRQLIQLAPSAHLSAARFEQQVLFQEAVRLLSASIESPRSSPATLCAEKAAEYLRSHYREEITAKELGEKLSFHPVYIARCMQQEYGCSPMEYLLRYRIEQSKLLLLQTDYTVARIAEEVGFNQTPYFSSRFARYEGISPRQYRQRFSHR
ncbi:helix-turn-helix transcriptional regulator [Cohnella thermotolerans]|uniref:helix-turn-helix transcriptional regulator n=1 Tax=Cohnella thermotolerans TaxID=329858 RepID=UPI000428EC91|nr:AraC family transcriptional regulator [Cohnella thermotolerans]